MSECLTHSAIWFSFRISHSYRYEGLREYLKTGVSCRAPLGQFDPSHPWASNASSRPRHGMVRLLEYPVELQNQRVSLEEFRLAFERTELGHKVSSKESSTSKDSHHMSGDSTVPRRSLGNNRFLRRECYKIMVGPLK